ncbi:MAG: hypothetical protein ACRCZF_27660, partial [Gemmataceae bacterium]
FTGGVQVSAGDVDNDGFADIILGTGIGGGPRVQAMSGKTGETLVNFFAYESTFRNGVQVSTGDVDGDGVLDVVTGSGVGGGPRVRAFSARSATPIIDFFAYDDTFRTGVNVSAGDIDGDGRDEIITGPGSTGIPNVRAFRADGSVLADFYVNDEISQKQVIRSIPKQPGVRVASTDLNKDGIDEILTGQAAGTDPVLRGFSLDANSEMGISEVRAEMVFGEGYNFGVFVG